MTREPYERLPGEDYPIPMEPGRALTDDEVLGVARRWAKRRDKSGRRALTPKTLPDPDHVTMVSYRLPELVVWRARARAEAEGRSVNDVVRELLETWGSAPMGSQIRVEGDRGGSAG